MSNPKPHIPSILAAIYALVLILSVAVAPAYAQTRTQYVPFNSVTLSTQQILLGETQGQPVTLAGELRLPAGTNKVPVVVLVHGAGGLLAKEDGWARALNSWGIGVFIPDHLSGRGIAPMSAGDIQLAGSARMVDVYHALPVLLQHPRVDPERIALMGFSLGGYVTLLSSQERFRTRHGPSNAQFAMYIALYPSCAVRLRDDAKVAARPIRIFYGTADNWTSVEQCRTQVSDLRKAGADVTLTEYPGATHAYDEPSFKVRLDLPQTVSLRKCSLAEGDGGQVLNSQTGNPLTASDACLERGVSIQYDEAVTASTREAVKGLLISVLAAKPAAAASADTKVASAFGGQGTK